ncbi:Fc.00g067570.m01.CDS01 [Cosmosporella sp. VM-42]
MSFTRLSSPASADRIPKRSNSVPVRPRFNSQVTADRLRASSALHTPPFKMGGNIRKGRRSVFKELGLDDDSSNAPSPSVSAVSTPPEFKSVSYTAHDEEKRFGEATDLASESKADEQHHEKHEKQDDKENMSPNNECQRQRQNSLPSRSWYAKLTNSRGRPRIKSTSSAAPGTISGLQRFTLIAMLIAVVIPAFSWRKGQSVVDVNGADAGVIKKRADSPTDACIRWAHQAALLNGTFYIYGGRAKTDGDQQSDTWNNNFLKIDLTKDWDIDSPPIKGLPQPDGPPAVALGYLWHDYNNLYLYGGQFSDTPYVDPEPESVWKYSINDGTWTEFKDPKTSAGNASDPADQTVHRAAEGAGISVPELGLSWYFGGHLDWATTPGWSQQVDRVYLKSLLEFTHPGYVNTGVDDLSGDTGAGEEGAFRNITKAGVQAKEFPERADGVLVFVPGWGEQGVLIGLAGGTAEEFTPDLKSLDVYDIANSKWFHQDTSGDVPSVRVNPCAVVASAPDASSFQIYVFGGQNLQPYGDQEQYNDMYILTIPAFTWIKVNATDSTPSPRAGHTCSLWDGQMIVVGGYIGNNTKCDAGFYVFDASTLSWQDSFKAGDHDPDFHPDNAVLAGSYGYSVPKEVQKVIGGNQDGSATVTTPASGATGGPFATGRAPVFTITQAGPTATSTHNSGSGSGGDDGGGNDESPRLIAAGVVAGVLGALALYLGFCAWLYRRQVRAYKRHLAIQNRYSGASTLSSTSLVPPSSTANRGGRNSHESFGWVGPAGREPKWTPDQTTPSGSGSGGGKMSQDTRPGTSSSGGSTEGLLDGQEPSFFSVVLGPRRALRVVNANE